MTGVQTCERSLPADRIVTDPGALRWGIVATVKAPLADIARFAAWHLDLGAACVDLYLDAPDPETLTCLAAHPRVNVTACDDTYWTGKPQKARSTHQLRQVFNASQSYRRSGLDWLGHLDVDEFTLNETPVAQMLAAAPPDCACLRLPPVEMLASDGHTSHFKRTPSSVGLAETVLHRLYPEFAALLPQGFVSYTTHKTFARTGIGPLRFGIHQLTTGGKRIDNAATAEGASIGHAHSAGFDTFAQAMTYRLTHGSYRNQKNGNPRLYALLTALMAEDGNAGLRRFYTEVCTARPALLELLRAQDMLISRDMDLGACAARHFGTLPQIAP